MRPESSPLVTETIDWVESELPEKVRHNTFARNHCKHRSNLADAIGILGDRTGDILDIGSGIGVFPAAMSHLGHNVTSVDIKTGSQSWLADHGVASRTCNTLTDLLPFPDASLDLVSMLDVIEHLHGSPRHSLSEVLRVLRPGGHLIIETPNTANLRRRLALLVGNNPSRVKNFYESSYPYRGHVYEYTQSDLEDVLRWSGFELITSRHGNVANRFHKIDKGYAPGLRIRGLGDAAMFAYLGICLVVPSFMDVLLCIARRPE